MTIAMQKKTVYDCGHYFSKPRIEDKPGQTPPFQIARFTCEACEQKFKKGGSN